MSVKNIKNSHYQESIDTKDVEINKINWFPGHMKKATDEIIKKINDIDFVIEVIDARAINVTSNYELLKLINNKPLLRVALKSDLSDISSNHNDLNLIIGNIKQKNFKHLIIEKLKTLLKEKIERSKKKGLINYQFIGLVVGIPNVGKSSLINYLSNQNSLIVQNRAGVTKKQNIKKINQNFYLIDTPGILFKRIDNILDGYKLAILNNISNKILPLYDVIKFHFLFLNEFYNSALKKYFNYKDNMNFETFISYVANNYKFITKNQEIDLERTLFFLFNLFSNSEICKFHYE